jgi:hypothetical protein
MAVDAYLQIEGIKGESVDDRHKDWIEVSHVAWSVHQARASVVSTAGGRGATKRLLFVCLLFSADAEAQEISCPKFYPSEDVVLGEVPYRHSGKGVLKKQELSGASWMGGDFNDTFVELAGGSEKVKAAWILPCRRWPSGSSVGTEAGGAWRGGKS